jgi:predicted HicB family RNase H-like nuclease
MPERIQFKVRMTPKMHKILVKAAKANGVSLNAEINIRLSETIIREQIKKERAA